jgi:hypothetical protein
MVIAYLLKSLARGPSGCNEVVSAYSTGGNLNLKRPSITGFECTHPSQLLIGGGASLSLLGLGVGGLALGILLLFLFILLLNSL